MPQFGDVDPWAVIGGLVGAAMAVMLAITQVGSFVKIVGEFWAKVQGRPAPGSAVEEAEVARADLDLVTSELHKKVAQQQKNAANLLHVRAGEMRVAWEVVHSSPQVLADGTARFRVDQWVEKPGRRTVENLAEFLGNQLDLKPISLVVLGSRAAGKSAASVLLARSLLESWEPGKPVAVHFYLRRWGQPYKGRLMDWLAEQLEQGYPMLRSKKYGTDAARALLGDARILPILEGLDEMHESDRVDLFEDISEAFDSFPGLVITARPEEYEAVGREGRMLPARFIVVRLQSVEISVARAYLQTKITPERLPRWERVFALMESEPGGPLAEAVSEPLILFLLPVIYGSSKSSPDELLPLGSAPQGSAEAIREHLLERFPKAVLDGDRWDLDKAHRWLGHLAELTESHEREIAWWELSDFGGRTLSALTRVLASSIAGAAVAAAVIVVFNPLAGLIFGLLTAALFFVFTKRKVPPKDLEVKWNGDRLPAMAISGSLVGLIILVAASLARDVWFALPLSAFGVLIGALYATTGDDPNAEPADPLYLLHREIRVGLVFGLTYGLFAGAVGFILSRDLIVAIIVGMLSGLAGGMLQGPIWVLSGRGPAGVTAYGNLLLATLYFGWKGKAPLRLMKFLGEAHSKGVLRVAGGKYQFRHPTLHQVMRKSVQPPAAQLAPSLAASARAAVVEGEGSEL